MPATKLSTCPDWCTRDHRDDNPDADPDVTTWHVVDHAETDLWGVTIEQAEPDGAVSVWVPFRVDVEPFTPQQARDFAAALISAAERVDALNP